MARRCVGEARVRSGVNEFTKQNHRIRTYAVVGAFWCVTGVTGTSGTGGITMSVGYLGVGIKLFGIRTYAYVAVAVAVGGAGAGGAKIGGRIATGGSRSKSAGSPVSKLRSLKLGTG